MSYKTKKEKELENLKFVALQAKSVADDFLDKLQPKNQKETETVKQFFERILTKVARTHKDFFNFDKNYFPKHKKILLSAVTVTILPYEPLRNELKRFTLLDCDATRLDDILASLNEKKDYLLRLIDEIDFCLSASNLRSFFAIEEDYLTHRQIIEKEITPQFFQTQEIIFNEEY